MKIEVTKNDIAASKRQRTIYENRPYPETGKRGPVYVASLHCPIAKAVKKATKAKVVSVEAASVHFGETYISEQSCELPEEAQQFIDLFDSGADKIEPISFEIC